jgi:hypothetical protein
MSEGEHKTSLNWSEPMRGKQTKLVVMVMNVCMSKPEIRQKFTQMFHFLRGCLKIIYITCGVLVTQKTYFTDMIS